MDKIKSLIERFNHRDRNALGKLITVIESTAPDARDDKERVLREIKKCGQQTMRVAISGPPGVGKSTFINTLGQKLIAEGLSVAVLPIDPSSEVSGGSVLADKTRMKELMQSDRAYIRPSPSKGTLGGIARFTSDLIFVVEAFGFDVVMIETVGVGQSETLARMLADHFVLLMQPGAGDHLQAMKKGILEKADFILINKADGDLEKLAAQTKRTLKASRATGNAVDDHNPFIGLISGLMDAGVDEFVRNLQARQKMLITSGKLDQNRASQEEQYYFHLFDQVITQEIRKIAFVKERNQRAIASVRERKMPISVAVNDVVSEICTQSLKVCTH